MDNSLKPAPKKPTGRPKRLTEQLERELCQRYRDNPALEYAAVGREYGVSRGTVLNTLLRNGIFPPTRRGMYAFPTTRFWKARSCAKARGIEFTITMEDMQEVFNAQNGRCPYTGWELTFPAFTDSWEGSASVDRIDSTKGYVKGNIQWVNKFVNLMKHKHTHSDFIELCRAIAAHHVGTPANESSMKRLTTMRGYRTDDKDSTLKPADPR